MKKKTIIIDKNKDIINCKDKIKVYYTTISFKKIRKAKATKKNYIK